MKQWKKKRIKKAVLYVVTGFAMLNAIAFSVLILLSLLKVI